MCVSENRKKKNGLLLCACLPRNLGKKIPPLAPTGVIPGEECPEVFSPRRHKGVNENLAFVHCWELEDDDAAAGDKLIATSWTRSPGSLSLSLE